jgi:ubiquinone/menaquinone biosynthesis C-methylase UbiE
MEIYNRFLNPETREAQSLWKRAMMERIRGMEGLVADVATGLWGLAQEMLETNPGIIPVSSDIDPLLLEWKRGRVKAATGREFHSVASDAIHFSFADGTFGGIANADGLINMSDAAAFLGEMRRTLKPGGRLAIMHRLFYPDSRSYGLARVYGIHGVLEAGPLAELLESAGFSDAKVVEISQAVWSENPGQSFPLAGDIQRFAIVEATK